MSWDFETDPAYQEQLDWAALFVREEAEPLDHVLGSPFDVKNPDFIRLVRPLQDRVRAQGLWACHLGPELGGPGYGQVKLALLNEILGRSRYAPIIFGTAAPDTGNGEILAHYGTPEQKQQFLQPLLDNEIVSCFAMTEPQGGADPLVIATTGRLEGGEWAISGYKWFASNGNLADFFIVMAVTEPEAADPYRRMSMLIVPAATPGIRILRTVGNTGEPFPSSSYIHFDDVRVPADHILGGRGDAFVVAQTRLGGGRIHHAMRTIGEVQKAFEMTCQRVLSRSTQGSLLADKQMVQEKIADCWIAIEQFRLLVLRTAWRIDKFNDYRKVRRDIAAVKAAMPKVLHDVAGCALHLHGSIGVSDEMPFMRMVAASFVLGLADGPTEVHKVTVARQTLREYRATTDLFPSYHLPRARAAALEKFGMDIAELDV